MEPGETPSSSLRLPKMDIICYQNDADGFFPRCHFVFRAHNGLKIIFHDDALKSVGRLIGVHYGQSKDTYHTLISLKDRYFKRPHISYIYK